MFSGSVVLLFKKGIFFTGNDSNVQNQPFLHTRKKVCRLSHFKCMHPSSSHCPTLVVNENEWVAAATTPHLGH